MIAALFVEKNGVYFDLPNVDPWDIERNAMEYCGIDPVICHSPCQRWGKFWHGSTRKPHQYKLGDDGGAFQFALDTVRYCGGVLEHPAHSKAWNHFKMIKPTQHEGWSEPDEYGGRSCYVEQGHYGHMSRKPTWLYAVGLREWTQLNWTRAPQRLHEKALAKYGYEKARRIGMAAMVGGKDKTKIRERTPVEFRDVLIKLATGARGWASPDLYGTISNSDMAPS